VRPLSLLARRRAPARRAPSRRDPAPSVWAYRWQRLLLTPLFRRTVRFVLPIALSLLAGALWLNTGDHRERVVAGIQALKDGVREREAFMVRALEVTGADAPLLAAVTGLMALDLPLSSFDLDLEAHRAAILRLAPVRDVSLRLREGVLVVAVEQRQPVAVWRHADGLRLIDPEGVMTGMIADRADRADLPLIAGDGAHEAIGEALALFAAAAPVAPRVRGLVRMGERRWDMVLEDDVRLLLPAEGAVAALERVVALHQAQELLDRDVAAVDMRLARRPTLRLNRPALNVLRASANPAASPTAPIPED
jgi:cell division protein FtsQ